MTNFRKWFKGEYPAGHTSGYYFAHKAWQYRQQEIDQLKAQLNNMEACYIEKKKQVDAAKQLIEDLNKCYQQDHQNKFEYWRGFADSAGTLRKRLEQALKGGEE